MTNITDADIEAASDDVNAMGEMGMENVKTASEAYDADFNETLHPRGKPENAGQFVEVSGSEAAKDPVMRQYPQLQKQYDSARKEATKNRGGFSGSCIRAWEKDG